MDIDNTNINILPAQIYTRERIIEIHRAVSRSIAERKPVNLAWIEEYNRLIEIENLACK